MKVSLPKVQIGYRIDIKSVGISFTMKNYERELSKGAEGVKFQDACDAMDRTQAWNLPVLQGGQYVGFVSRSKLFGAYRNWLQAVSEE